MGIRVSLRGETLVKPRDPFLLCDVSTILLDCGTRPEEYFRLRWEQCRNGTIEITYGKTDNVSQRVQSILAIRRGQVEGPWIFASLTKSGHIEPSSLQGQHAKACKRTKLEYFPIYTFRHTCLTR